MRIIPIGLCNIKDDLKETVGPTKDVGSYLGYDKPLNVQLQASIIFSLPQKYLGFT
jgi:hypothetical protein